MLRDSSWVELDQAVNLCSAHFTIYKEICMLLFRGVAVSLGVAVSVALVAGPAAAAPSRTVYENAHVGFENPDVDRVMTVDLDRINGKALLDVEWATWSCDAPTGPRTCMWVFRNAQDVVPSRARLSLRAASVTADVTYTEFTRTCHYERDDEEVGPCTETPKVAAVTRFALSWTASGEEIREWYRDDEGRLHFTRRTFATASGTAFGESFPVEQSAITQLSRTVVYETS